jgi:hypothetical protein
MTQTGTNESTIESEQTNDKRDWYKNHTLSEDERQEIINRKIKLLELYSFRSENQFYGN